MSPEADQGERELLTRAMLGEEADFARLLEIYYDTIYRLAWRQVGNRDDAQDVAQDVCIKLAHGLASYRFDAPFRIWLARMTINAARDFLRQRVRRQGRELPLFEDAEFEAPASDPEKLAAARQMLRVVQDLPEDLREAVILVFGEEMSHAEAAQALGIAESTVSWRIHEARKSLKVLAERRSGHGRG